MFDVRGALRHTASCRYLPNRAIATHFRADMGKTLLFGTTLAIPTVILPGPVYARFLKGVSISRSRKPVQREKPFYGRRDAGKRRQRLDVAGSGDSDGDACGCRDDTRQKGHAFSCPLPSSRRPGNGMLMPY